MNDLKIDIAGTPPTQKQLAKWREEARQNAARADAAERRITRWNWIVVTVSVLILVSLLLGIGPNVGYTLTSVAVAVAAAVAVAVAMAGAGAGAGAGAVVGAVVGVVAVAVAADVDGAVAVAGAVAGAGAAAGAGAGAAAAAAAGVPYDKWVEKPRTLARELLETLTELSPDQHATECAAYFGWFEKDETVQRYQRQVAAQERNPIMAEYRAAKLWVTTADERQAQAEKIEKARVACERLRTADL